MSDRLAQIERLLEVGRLKEARELIALELAERPGDPELAVHSARIAIAEEDYAEARGQIAHALEHAPDHFYARYLLFLVDVAEQRYAEAEQTVTQLIREYPEEPGLYAEYAELMLKTLHLDKARRLVDEALRLEPSHRSARLTSVLLATVEGDREHVDEQLHELVRTDPESRRIAAMLMVTLIDRHRYAEALEIAQELLRSDPENEHFVDAVVELRSLTHWMAWPLWPLNRFGWIGSATLWLGALIGIGLARSSESPWVMVAVFTYLGWVVYSWAYGPLMQRWLRHRGV